MQIVDTTEIKRFCIPSDAPHVPQSSEPVAFILTSDQIRSIIREATAPLEREVQDLKQRISDIEFRQDQDYERFAGDICDHGQRLTTIEKTELQPLQRDRSEILRALIVANGGRLLAQDARKKMRLSKQSFTNLLSVLKDDIENKPLHTDKRKRVLSLK